LSNELEKDYSFVGIFL